MLRQASAEVGVAAVCTCVEKDGLSMAPSKLHDACAMIAIQIRYQALQTWTVRFNKQCM